MKRTFVATLAVALSFATVGIAAPAPQSDAQAVEIATATLEAMGGAEAWNETHFISWNFMGGRLHVWDKWSGNHRIEQETNDGEMVVTLLNVNTGNARIFVDGEELTDPVQLAERQNRAFQMWNNDTYWMFMPFKLLDPGVVLKYVGERDMEDGRAADVVELTFEDVGDTPENKYWVFVAKDSGLVEQWTHWTGADDPEPRFTLPWSGWQEFGGIMLATNKGRDRDWSIQVHDELPESVFTDPMPLFGQER